MKEKKVKFVAHEGGKEMNLLEAIDYVTEIVDVKSEDGIKFLEDKAEEALNNSIEYHEFSKKLSHSVRKITVAIVVVFFASLIVTVLNKLFGIELFGSASGFVHAIFNFAIIVLTSFNLGLSYAVSRVNKESDMYSSYSALCMAVILKNETSPKKDAHKKAKNNTPKKESKDVKGKSRKA